MGRVLRTDGVRSTSYPDSLRVLMITITYIIRTVNVIKLEIL